MARKKHFRRSNGGFKIPLAVAAGFAVPVSNLAQRITWANPVQEVARESSRIFLGWDNTTGQFNFSWMKYGTLPVLLGMAVHKIIGGKLGVNRLLGRAGIPLIRL